MSMSLCLQVSSGKIVFCAALQVLFSVLLGYFGGENCKMKLRNIGKPFSAYVM